MPAGVGLSIILIAVGAILVWAVTGDAEGIDEDAIGVILMIVGVVGLVLSLLFRSAPWGDGGYRRRRYVEGEPRPRRREVVEEEEIGP